MKRTAVTRSIPAFLILILAISLAACTKKDNDSDTPAIYGNWARSYSGSEVYHAQLNLTKSGVFEWIMLDTLSTHTNSVAQIHFLSQ